MELPRQVPVMLLPGTVLFPGALVPLYIFEPRYRRMLKDVLESHRMYAVAMTKPSANREIPYPVAGLGLVRAAVKRPDGTSYVILQGLSRVALESTIRYKPYRIHAIRIIDRNQQKREDTGLEVDALTAKVKELVEERIHQGFQISLPLLKELKQLGEAEADSPAYPLHHFLKYISELKDPGQMADLVSCTMLHRAEEKQTVLEALNLERRLKHLIHFLMADIQRNRNHS